MPLQIKRDDGGYGEREAEVTRLHQQVKRLMDQARHLHQQLDEAIEQCNGGGESPETCKEHPGRILMDLGWKYDPPMEQDGDELREIGTAIYCWRDPLEVGTGKVSHHTFPGAMTIVYRRLLERLTNPTAWERLAASD